MGQSANGRQLDRCWTHAMLTERGTEYKQAMAEDLELWGEGIEGITDYTLEQPGSLWWQVAEEVSRNISQAVLMMPVATHKGVYVLQVTGNARSVKNGQFSVADEEFLVLMGQHL